ncbi:hypothetical protein [Bifidobacterium jacchi]|uniref:Uncharacterized protein n=1 Tax=Bifidobacterium jacchi TaxID=2490545 RepID=A0A5N5RJB0_9BIFI|nr:hypothetical protein [Bifidobacterium jacchi]KAB5607392.1 hypothetical protein EHS19_04905 [Bifidobacterium jacchi]
MSDFLMRLSDLRVAVRSMHDRIERQCADYLLPSSGFEQDAMNADIAVAITPGDIAHERELATQEGSSDDYLETLAVFRRIAEQLPALHRVVFHGATISFAGRAWLFTAPSGTGKTTHIRLWREVYGDRVGIINGDKPILHIGAGLGGATLGNAGLGNATLGSANPDKATLDKATPDIADKTTLGKPGEPDKPDKPDNPDPTDTPRSCETIAYGTPWAGKENWQANTSAPLGGICVVTRGTDNVCSRIGVEQALPLIARQTYMPADLLAVADTLELLDVLLRTVPIYLLRCTISPDAVRASHDAMIH